MMMMTHDDALELAAAAIDFPLDHDEEMALSAHLAACVACRRRAMALDNDQRTIRALPAQVLDPGRVEHVRRQVAGDRRGQVPVLRLLAIAAMLALLAISALAVGSRLLRTPDSELSTVDTALPVATLAVDASGPLSSQVPATSGAPTAGPLAEVHHRFRRRRRRQRASGPDGPDRRQHRLGQARTAP